MKVDDWTRINEDGVFAEVITRNPDPASSATDPQLVEELDTNVALWPCELPLCVLGTRHTAIPPGPTLAFEPGITIRGVVLI